MHGIEKELFAYTNFLCRSFIPLVPFLLQSGSLFPAPSRVTGAGQDRSVEEVLGGRFQDSFSPRTSARPSVYGTWEVTLQDTGTMWEEQFLVGMPRVAQSPAPLLVAFHGWGNSEWDIAANTHYFQKAMARGWMVVAPLGAHKFNYSIDYSQQNTEAALDWVLQNFDVDTNRIYGVGFSMGGGSAATYAARHLDPGHARLAAVVDHTGSVSIEHVWWSVSDKSILENALMFQGPPSNYPFRYQQASVIDMDGSGNIDPATNLARNLVFTPMKEFAVSGDPNHYLVDETTALHTHLSGMGGDSQLQIVNGNTHEWSTLNEDAVLDWLSARSLVEPPVGSSVRMLADRNGKWRAFKVDQATPNKFSPFRFTIDTTNNRLILDQVENISSIAFHPAETGLDFFADPSIEVMVDLHGPMSMDIVIHDYDQTPSSVVRTGDSNPSWTWDPSRDTVTLHETNGAGYPRWTVTR
jgi:acetyl esterase/lipase